MGLLVMGMSASVSAAGRQPISWFTVLGLSTGATGMYALLRLWSLDRHPELVNWSTWLKAAVFIGVVAGILLVSFNTIHLPWLTGLSLLTIAYHRLRKFPVIKTFLLSLVFALLPLALYWNGQKTLLLPWPITLQITGNGILIWSITLLFDARDATLDRQELLITLPQMLGPKLTWMLSLLGISLAFFLHLFTPVQPFSLALAYLPVLAATLYWPVKQTQAIWYILLDLSLVWWAWGFYLGLPL